MVMCLLVLLLFLYLPTQHAVLMYQQNRYRNDRYHLWLKNMIHTSYKMMISIMLILMINYVLFLLPSGQMPQYFFITLLLIFIYVSYKQIQLHPYRKPLIYTGRVKRLFAVLYGIYVLLLCMILHYTNIWFWIFITPFLYFLPWILIMLSGLLVLPIEQGIQRMYMKDAQAKLQQMHELRTIGITGSYGKTSVKHILNELLKQDRLTLMTPKSYNNRMGITLTIRKHLKPIHELFLCEMGADHIHEISELMNFVQPQIGIVTAIGPQHLQTFHSMGAIIHEKMQMIEKLPRNGIGFLNIDNSYITGYHIKNKCTIIWFGNHMNADYRICNIRYSKEGTTFDLVHLQQRHEIQTKLLGEHNVLNITCAIAVAHTLGISWETCINVCKRLPYVEHRLQKVDSSAYTILDDAYNANPQGARYALDVLRQMQHTRFLVTPGFIDLGERQNIENYQLGRDIVGCADEVILVGKVQTQQIAKGLHEAGFSSEHLHIVSTIDQAFQILNEKATQQDVVLIENDLPDAFNH